MLLSPFQHSYKKILTKKSSVKAKKVHSLLPVCEIAIFVLYGK